MDNKKHGAIWSITKEKQMSEKGNWLVVSSIDFEQRCVVIEVGVKDSFGEFHPTGNAQGIQHPSWLLTIQQQTLLVTTLGTLLTVLFVMFLPQARMFLTQQAEQRLLLAVQLYSQKTC
jgi:hypothetical protein